MKIYWLFKTTKAAATTSVADLTLPAETQLQILGLWYRNETSKWTKCHAWNVGAPVANPESPTIGDIMIDIYGYGVFQPILNFFVDTTKKLKCRAEAKLNTGDLWHFGVLIKEMPAERRTWW